MASSSSHSLLSPLQHERCIADLEETVGFLLNSIERWKQDMEQRTKEEIREAVQRYEVSSAQLDQMKTKNTMLKVEIHCLRGRGCEQGEKIRDL